MTEKDLQQLPELWEISGLPYRPTGRDQPEELKTQRRMAPDLFIGAFVEAKMVGAVIGTDDGRKGWINRLAVHPDYRKSGLGMALVRACEDALAVRGRGVIGVLIEGENDSSEILFQKAGYKREDDIKYYAKRDSDAT